MSGLFRNQRPEKIIKFKNFLFRPFLAPKNRNAKREEKKGENDTRESKYSKTKALFGCR